jgi:hypothetical protein
MPDGCGCGCVVIPNSPPFDVSLLSYTAELLAAIDHGHLVSDDNAAYLTGEKKSMYLLLLLPGLSLWSYRL